MVVLFHTDSVFYLTFFDCTEAVPQSYFIHIKPFKRITSVLLIQRKEIIGRE